MPDSGLYITCVRVQNQILISSQQFRVISYDYEDEVYSYVGLQSYSWIFRCIVSSKENLYLFEGKEVFVISKTGEILETITTKKDEAYSQVYSNTEGKIFLLQYSGPVNYFDLFGEKQIKRLLDLQQD